LESGTGTGESSCFVCSVAFGEKPGRSGITPRRFRYDAAFGCCGTTNDGGLQSV
jgi:hypothetical protein